ncbi:MAG: hypothetical protein WKF40_01670 [Thermoleophilaceae bacterium]
MRKYFWLPILMALAAYVLLPLPGEGKPPLGKRIEGKRAKVQKSKRREAVLTTDITGINNRIRGLQGQISGTQKRLTTVQDDLDDKRAELLRVRNRLEVARDRLVRVRAQLKASRRALRDRLVELYKADQPDALTVVLEADGFNDLLERTDFLERISDQDGTVLKKVRVLKAKAEKTEKLLSTLETQRRRAAETILRRRDDIAATKDRLTTAQGDLRGARKGRRATLARVRDIRHSDQEDLAGMEREQAEDPEPAGVRRRPRRRTDPQGLGPADLAGERPDHGVIRRGAPRAHTRRDRHLRAQWHPDPRRRLGEGRADGLHRWLRQLHLHPAHGQHVHVLRPSVPLRDLAGGVRQARSSHGLRGQHRALIRRPPALRGAHQRLARSTPGLPLAAIHGRALMAREPSWLRDNGHPWPRLMARSHLAPERLPPRCLLSGGCSPSSISAPSRCRPSASASPSRSSAPARCWRGG